MQPTYVRIIDYSSLFRASGASGANLEADAFVSTKLFQQPLPLRSARCRPSLIVVRGWIFNKSSIHLCSCFSDEQEKSYSRLPPVARLAEQEVVLWCGVMVFSLLSWDRGWWRWFGRKNYTAAAKSCFVLRMLSIWLSYVRGFCQRWWANGEEQMPRARHSSLQGTEHSDLFFFLFEPIGIPRRTTPKESRDSSAVD